MSWVRLASTGRTMTDMPCFQLYAMISSADLNHQYIIAKLLSIQQCQVQVGQSVAYYRIDPRQPRSLLQFQIHFQMIRQLLILLLAYSLICSVQSADTPPVSNPKDIPVSKVGDLIKGVNYKLDQGKSFQLITIAALQKKYLFLALTSDNIYYHLNFTMTIYKEKQQSPLQTCLKDELDSCYLPRESLTENETLFVVIDSGEECEYQLQTYWSNLEHMAVDKEIKFTFAKQEQRQIYHLELEGKKFEQLRIVIKPETRRFAFDKVKIFGSFGKDSQPSSDQHDFASVHLWQDAEGIYLTRKQLKHFNMNIIVYGATETVYTLLCTLVNKTHHDILINHKTYEYLDKGRSSDYHISFKDEKGEFQYDTYVFRIAVFSGDLSVDLYYDETKKQKIGQRPPFKYMGDIQYVYDKQQIQQQFPNGIHLTMVSKQRVSTFMMEVEGRAKQNALELHEHIYQLLPVNKKQTLYFRVSRYGEQATVELQSLKVSLTMIDVLGSNGVSVRKCLKTLEECTGQLALNNTSEVSTQYRQLGSKHFYSWAMTSDFWSSVNKAEKSAIVIIILANFIEYQSFAAIEYNVGNRPQFLRQNKPIESHVLRQQLKIYKYVNEDTNIKVIRVHINQISGNFNAYCFRHEPTEQQLTADSNRITNGVAQLTDDLIETPIVIVIRGEDSATYSIVVQPVHVDEHYINSITLSEDVEFKIKIGPNKFEIFQIVPISGGIYFSYHSTAAVHVCTLNTDNVCPNIEEDIYTNQGEVVKEEFSEGSLFIKLRNPYPNRTIEVVSIFHSTQKSHCERRKMNQLYKEVVTEGDCLSTVINASKDFQVLIVREQLGIYVYYMTLCDRALPFTLKDGDEGRYLITAQQIENNCKRHSEIVFCLLTGSQIANASNQTKAKTTKAHLKYLVQFSTDKIILPDGVGYQGSEVSTGAELKIFIYTVLNRVDTEIILSTFQKLYLLVKIIDASRRDSTTINSNDFDFSSSNQKSYRADSIYLKIAADQLKQANCTHCELLIHVYSKQPTGQTVEYTLQVIQNFIALDQGKHKRGYLLQNSRAYYGFNTKSKGVLVVELTDNNRNCAELYLNTKEYPDQNNYLQKSYDGQIIQEVYSPKAQTFYIAVNARLNCQYSIAAALSTGKIRIMKLQRGVLAYSNIKQGETRYFTFRHLSDRPFKIMSLHKYGQVEIYLNKTSPLQVSQLLQDKQIQHKQFSYHSDYNNRLVLDSSRKEFCKGCYYIVAIEAVKHTQSSIFLGDEETKVPLNEEKVVNDVLLKENSFTKGQFYYMKDVMMEVRVHSGKLQVEVTYFNQSFNQTFEKSSEPAFYNFTIKQSDSYYGTVNTVFKALADNTVYSLRIKKPFGSSTDSESTQINMNPVESNFLYLIKGKPTCINGFLKRSDQRIFFSFRMNLQSIAAQLNITGKMDGNTTQILQQTTRNVIAITFLETLNSTMHTARSYQLCLSHLKDSLPLTVMQSEQTSLLPENTEMLVIEKQTYDIYPEGDFLLDVFECRGESMVSYGSSRSELQGEKSKELKSIGILEQSHAIRIDSAYSNVLFTVQGEQSLIRWFPINEQKEVGLGYYVYKAGSLAYDSEFRVIEVIIEPIRTVKKTINKIQGVVYNLYVSSNEKDLKQASLCERFLPKSVLEFKAIPHDTATAPFKYKIEKQILHQKYQQASNLFFTVVADVTVSTSTQKQEEYRFVYATSEIPAQIMKLNSLQSSNLVLTLAIIISLILAIFIFTWACVKIIVPMISRLKSSTLVEENGLQISKDKKSIHDDQIDPPPSSDRQSMHFRPQPPVQTDQKMAQQ